MSICSIKPNKYLFEVPTFSKYSHLFDVLLSFIHSVYLIEDTCFCLFSCIIDYKASFNCLYSLVTLSTKTNWTYLVSSLESYQVSCPSPVSE